MKTMQKYLPWLVSLSIFFVFMGIGLVISRIDPFRNLPNIEFLPTNARTFLIWGQYVPCLSINLILLVIITRITSGENQRKAIIYILKAIPPSILTMIVGQLLEHYSKNELLNIVLFGFTVYLSFYMVYFWPLRKKK